MMRIIVLLLLLPAFSRSQDKLNLTLFGGLANYSGDLQEKRFTIDQAGPAFGAGLSYQLVPRLLLRGALTLAKIGADDKQSTKPLYLARNLNFKSPIYEASLLVDYSFINLDDHRFTPYIFAGVALFHFNPYTHDSLGTKYYLRNLGTEGQGLSTFPDRHPYKLTRISIPFGGGVRFRINDKTVLGYEVGLRKTPTDYLDDVSTTYANEAALLAERGPKAVELSYRGGELKDGSTTYPNNGVRGGSKYKDWYYFQGLTLSISIMNSDGGFFWERSGHGGMSCPRPVL